MNLTSSSLINDDNERLNRREKSIFYENTLSEIENHHKSTLNFLDDKINSYICDQCSKIFASEYGLNYHINMHHPNQSILCSDCNIIFRSHRALKNHQQRFHLISSQDLPNYNHISSYLVVAFSAQQFSFIAKNACEQGYLPLGEFTSKLFQCQFCHLSFPCSNALKYHLINQHEQYEYNLCKTILYDMILQVEQNLRTVNDDEDDMESMKFLLSKQALHFGLVDKQLARECRSIKYQHNHQIFPLCQHQNRTCANLCLKYLSSYNKLNQNYPYKIPTIPKGNPFSQGSIVSKVTNGSTVNTSIISKESLNSNQKRTSLKRVKSSLQPKRTKLLSTVEQPFKTNEMKFISTGQSLPTLISSKKTSSKDHLSFTRSPSSMSSNSSTSTRSSLKNSRQQTLKRSISPTITLAVERSSEKRRRQREQRQARTLSSSSAMIKTPNDIEQENDDDDIIPLKTEQPKQRQASSGSVEYVQIINNDQQSISSLNNIENFKLKSEINDEEIILCHSSPSLKKVISSPNKNHSKTSINGIHKLNGHQTSDYDEDIRVRCKICGDIIEGRSRFSKHVVTMHSHLLKNNITDIKQQTPILYSV